MSNAIQHGIVQNVAAIIAKTTATASGKIILSKLSILIAKSLTPTIAKIIAMPAIKLAMKKMIAAAVIATIAKLMAAKLGMSVGAAMSFILIPLMLAWIAQDIYDIPEKLGLSLSLAVCGEIETNFEDSVGDMLTAVIAEFTSDRMIASFGNSIGADTDLLDQISSLMMPAK